MKLRSQCGWFFALVWFGIGSCSESPSTDAPEDGSVPAEAGVGVVAQKLLAPIEVTLTAVADTYISQSTPTLNFGTQNAIDVTGVALSGWEAGVVRFDTAAIRSAVGTNTLQTARLQLTMSSASLGAGNSQMTIHRMTVPWVEQRATWLCANDTDHSILGRFVNNCSSANRWGIEWWSFLPRPFVEQPTAIVPLGFGQTGVVTADVTSDVQLTLGGSTHEGWLLASTASLASVWARFSSREGSAPPKLLLTMLPSCINTGPDTDCDGIDDDCNGQVDEAYVSISTNCGTGGCARTGSTSCVLGSVRDSCTPGTPAASDTTCNGVDENCNGSIDEGYLAQATSCGIGACARSGVTSCTGGAVQNICMPGSPAASDASCDGVDDNCNGSIDEGYVGTATTCGIGACERIGMTACIAGSVQSPCMPGTPAPADLTCDGIDDNCNGVVDEEYVAQSTTCGVGACVRIGTTFCIGGAVQDSCLPGAPTASDGTCDGTDDDCSGTADEDFGQETTTCTVNGCSAYGATTCSAGQVIDTCSSEPTCFAEIDCTDGIDNDSDVQADCADNDCANAPSCASPIEVCGNNLDDDGDGLPDCADLDCVAMTPCNNIPPIAADVAPALDPTLHSRNIAALQFLIEGPTPIQVGVAPGTLVPAQAALVSGRVLAQGGAALPAVLVEVAHHPEFGLTYTDARGEFHLAVNGGALLMLQYSLSGYVPAQRPVQTAWGQGATADDAILLVRTPEVTRVDVTGTVSSNQVVVGPAESDSNGTRRATLVVPAGTAVQVYDAAGNVTALPQLSFRLTEHTVGEHGPEQMPAPLPPTSAYTYAIDISADEAPHKFNGIDALLSQPIPFYVDNFLSFPIGTSIPTGYYDNDANQWKPIDNGVTLAIVGEQAGLAQIDSNGDNLADSPATLAALAIDDAELAVLATRYDSGDSLWRVRLPHLSSYDLNMGEVADGDTFPPTPMSPPQVPPQDPAAPPCTMDGNSSVTCFRQVLDEEVPITGTAHALHYTSERVPGRTDNRSLSFPIRTENFPDLNLRAVQVRVTPPVGRTQLFEWEHDATPANFSWTWDGLDAFGRRLVGRYPIRAEVTYLYGCVYASASRFGFRDGAVLPSSAGRATYAASGGGAVSSGCRAPLRSQSTLLVESWDALQAGLGGWELTEHHSFHPDSGELLMGDGRRQVGGDTPATTLAAGPFPGPYGAAKSFRDTAIAPDGTLYIVNAEGIFRRRPNAAAQFLIASNGTCTSSDPYIERVCDAHSIAVDRTGHLIVVDQIQNSVGTRVLRVNPQTLAVRRIAGGPTGFSGDGGPALAARFNTLGDVAIQDDGSMLLMDTGNHAIRRIQEGGFVERIAGTGAPWSFGDVFTATADDATTVKVSLGQTTEVVPAVDGGFYFFDYLPGAVRHIDRTGKITTLFRPGFVGTLGGYFQRFEHGAFRDGILYATSGFMGGPHGVYALDTTRSPVVPERIAGTGFQPFPACGDTGVDTFPLRRELGILEDLSFGPDGELYLTETCHFAAIPGRVLLLRRSGRGAYGTTLVASQDRQRFYEFDGHGRHTRTIHGLTAQDLLKFEYDAAGRLAGVLDGDGQRTQIERASDGKPQAIVAPFGQRTELTSDNHGYLATIKPDPNHPAYRFTYRPDGLMTQLLDPAGSTHLYDYDALGLLSRTQDALGGYHQYDAARTVRTQTVTETTALGRVTSYEYTRDFGSNHYRITFPTGQSNERTVDKNGVSTTTLNDGTVTINRLVPDPTLGAQALLINETTTTPAGRTRTRSVNRSVAQTVANDPLSLTTLTETTTDNGRVSTQKFTKSNRMWMTTSPAARVVTVQLDGQGRVIKSGTPGTLPIELHYDSNGHLARIDQPLSSSVTERFSDFTFDPSSGYLDSQTNALAQVTSYQRDALGRIEHLVHADGSETGFGYDAESRITSVTPPQRSPHALTYTAVDLSKEYVSPQVGASPTITTYDFDLDRALRSITQPDGQQQTLGYHSSNGRLQSATIPGAGATTYGYDAQSRLQSLTNDAGQGSQTFSYDGSLLTTVATSGAHSVPQWSGSLRGSVVYGYNNQFDVSSIDVRGASGAPNGFAAQLVRDDDDLVTSIVPLGGGSAPTLTLTRSPIDGHLVASTQGVVRTEYAMDVNAAAPGYGELQGISNKVNGSELYGASYLRDALGRIERLDESIDGQHRTRKYVYDLVGRLHMVLDENDALIHLYDYDPNGARVGDESGAGSIVLGTNLGCGPTLNTPVDAQDRLCRYGDYNYAYDANGRLSSKTQISTGAQTGFVYDGLGQLRAVLLPSGSRIDYVLDTLGRRIGKVVAGALVRGWLYGENSLRPLAQLDASGQIEATFVYNSHGNVPDFIVAPSGAVYRVLTDHLGSVRLVVDVTSGAVVQRLNYDEFGVVLADTNPGFQPFGFAGGIYDADTELVRFGARDYDAVTGRWTAKDPILFEGRNTNVYAYVHNDPINFLDLMGLEPTPADVENAYKHAYERWWQNRPRKFRTWGPISNIKRNFDEDAPVCSDYAEAAAEAMNDSVDIPGTGAYSVWDFEEASGQLGVFDHTGDVDWSAHNTVQVYMTGADGKPVMVSEYDPWLRLW